MSEVQGHAAERPPASPEARLWLDAAARLGMESQLIDGELLELSSSGARRVMLGARSALNTELAAALVGDRFASSLLAARAGVPMPRTVRCVMNGRPDEAFDAAATLAEGSGFPLIVKPNRALEGRAVAVEDRRRLANAVRAMWDLDPVALVQENVPGRSFRLELLDGAFLIGLERRGLRVRGDGRRTLAELLIEKDPRFAERARRYALARDPRWVALLEQRGWTLSSVPKEGAALAFEGPIFRLSGACTARLVERVPEGVRALCAKVGEALGLRHFGVDLKAESLESEHARVVDVSAAPSLVPIAALGHREAALGAAMRVLGALFAS